jgi:hypothetical protein
VHTGIRTVSSIVCQVLITAFLPVSRLYAAADSDAVNIDEVTRIARYMCFVADTINKSSVTRPVLLVVIAWMSLSAVREYSASLVGTPSSQGSQRYRTCGSSWRSPD